jgi:hypothetical protein
MLSLYQHLMDRRGHGERSITFAIEQKGCKKFGSNWEREVQALIFK